MSKLTWTGAGGSVRGPCHVRNGGPNQDAWIAKNFQWGHVAVVSDGLGSKAHSDVGSKAACYAVVEGAKQYQKYQNADVTDLIRLIKSNWLLRIRPYSSYDCSATCLFAILIDDELILGRLGDGMIISLGNSEQATTILAADKKESFSNITKSLGNEFRIENWETKSLSLSEYYGIVLCTDGVADDILTDHRIGFASNLITTYRYMSRRRRSMDIRRWMYRWPVPGHDDDKTLACLIRET